MNADSVTYIGFCCDHSGSMKLNKRDELAINNFNEQLQTLLKEDDKTMDNLVTVVEFSDEIHCNIDGVPIDNMKEINSWWASGMTSLYDAIAYTIALINNKMKNDGRKDKAALIVVQTDGEENSSSDYRGEEGRQKINKRINELEETGNWSFTFLGENLDKKVAMDLGFKFDNIMSHQSGEGNTQAAYYASSAGLDSYMKARKLGATQTFNFYDSGNDTNRKAI